MENDLIDLSKVLGTNLLTAIRQQDADEAGRLLRKKDLDVAVTDAAGMGCLHYAASEGLTKITRRLIMEKGADVNTTDGIGQTPLHKAAAHGQIDIMVMLAALGGNLAEVDHMKNLPLTLAVKEQNLKAVETLLLLGSPAITEDATPSASNIQIKDEKIEGILTKHQKTVDALKHGEISRGLQHTYNGELPVADGSAQSSKAGFVHQMDFPDLHISVIHTSMKHPFVLYISRIRQDVAASLPQLSGDARLFGDIIECKSWFLPQTTVKMIITVDGISRMNERLDVQSIDETPFEGQIEGFPETDRNSDVTKVTVALTMNDSSSPHLTSFVLIATPRKEVFEITDKPAVLKPDMEPDSEIHIPERAFESPGLLNIEFTDSSEANEDGDDDDDPLLMTNIVAIAMEDNQQPIVPISIKLPVTCNAENSKDVVILVTSNRKSDETIHWTPIEATPESSSTSTTFQVSHFSTYVGVSRDMVKKRFNEVSIAASRSLSKQRKVVFFVMARSPNTRTDPYSIVVECCTKRKSKSRMKFWTSTGYQGKTPTETLQKTVSENERLLVRLEGMFDQDVKPMELTFLPNSASYKVFDQIFPRIQQGDGNSLAGGAVTNEPFIGEIIIEATRPMQTPEVVSTEVGCFSFLKMFNNNQLVPESVELTYARLGSIGFCLTMQDESPESEN